MRFGTPQLLKSSTISHKVSGVGGFNTSTSRGAGSLCWVLGITAEEKESLLGQGQLNQTLVITEDVWLL